MGQDRSMEDERLPDAPTYRLEFSADDEILVVMVTGRTDDHVSRLDCWNAINAHARKHEFRKMLMLDHREGRPASREELEELIAFCSEREYLADALAIVVRDSSWMPMLEQAEIIARTHDLKLRIFGDVQSAKYWLRFETDSPGPMA